MNKRDFAYYVMNQLEHRHYGGETLEQIIGWMNDFAQNQDDLAERTGDTSCADNAAVLRSMRDAYQSDGMRGCRNYLLEYL